MRVIAGTYGGRRLKAPRGSATRPTAERVREALFSILAERIPGARVLDLYAGSGALGIEALSRGAGSVTFVDNDARAIAVLNDNLATLQTDAEVLCGDALKALSGPRQYDLVLLDPPYGLAAQLGPILSQALLPALVPGATVVSESDRRAPLELTTLPLQDERRYGDTLIRIHGT